MFRPIWIEGTLEKFWSLSFLWKGSGWERLEEGKTKFPSGGKGASCVHFGGSKKHPPGINGNLACSLIPWRLLLACPSFLSLHSASRTVQHYSSTVKEVVDELNNIYNMSSDLEAPKSL
jgi:hypothetical protein